MVDGQTVPSRDVNGMATPPRSGAVKELTIFLDQMVDAGGGAEAGRWAVHKAKDAKHQIFVGFAPKFGGFGR